MKKRLKTNTNKMTRTIGRKKKTAAAVLSFVMPLILLSGCRGGDTVSPNHDGKPVSGSGNGQEQTPGATAMGRYVEEVIDLSGRISGYMSGLTKLEDGSLVISDGAAYFLSSADGGTTWEIDDREWRTRMIEEKTYVMDIAVGADNTAAVLYDAIRSGKTEEIEEESNAEENAYTWDSRVMIIKPDGVEIEADEIRISEEDKQLDKVFVSDTGRVFVTTYGPNIYEVKEDGSSEKYLTLENAPRLIRFQGNYMIMDGEHNEGLIIYDMEKQAYFEDEVLNDFVEENYRNRTANGGSFYDLYFFPGEENVVYLAGKKGLHRHVIGGSAIEQVIDGSLSSFNNPSYGIKGMIALDNNEFVVLFTKERLVKFTYNPDIPTVPEEKLKVYSLRDNNTLRQVITMYQAQYPAVYVEYEIGIEDGSAVTRDDALKKLNTEIMAGEGPDVLIMDNLPMDSYIEKGMLLDLSPVLESVSGENVLFENMINAFKTDEKIYAVPCEIGLPVLAGNKSYLPETANLEGVADMVEALRREHPEKNLLDLCSEKGVLKMFTMISTPYWKTGEGVIDRDAVADFFVQAKRIYDAQMDGLPEETIDAYRQSNQELTEIFGRDYEDSGYMRWGVDYLSYVMGIRQMTYGALASHYEYAALLSCTRVEGYEESEVILMNEDIFYPQTITAINAATGSREQAEVFLRLLLGKENQSSLFLGLPVNREAFEEISKTEAEPGEHYSSLSMMDEEGNITDLIVYWPDEEQISMYEKWMETVHVPYIEDDMLEEIVCEEGIRYLQGVQGIEDTVRAVENRAALYMAE